LCPACEATARLATISFKSRHFEAANVGTAHMNAKTENAEILSVFIVISPDGGVITE
jgi:hypothetical protein